MGTGTAEAMRNGEVGALFDWDGVVIDSSAQHLKSWELLAGEAGKPLPKDHFIRGFGMKNQVIIPRILEWTDDPEEIERYSLRKEALYREIIAREGISALPGVKSLLEMLDAQGVPCAVGSSTHRENIEAVLDILGVRARFKALVTAEDVTHGKPDPEVFVKSANAIGIRPEKCVVFEDAPVGVEAGLKAGARVIAVATTNEKSALRRANAVVDTLKDVDWPMFNGVFA